MYEWLFIRFSSSQRHTTSLHSEHIASCRFLPQEARGCINNSKFLHMNGLITLSPNNGNGNVCMHPPADLRADGMERDECDGLEITYITHHIWIESVLPPSLYMLSPAAPASLIHLQTKVLSSSNNSYRSQRSTLTVTFHRHYD